MASKNISKNKMILNLLYTFAGVAGVGISSISYIHQYDGKNTDGFRCVIPNRIGSSQISLQDQNKANDPSIIGNIDKYDLLAMENGGVVATQNGLTKPLPSYCPEANIQRILDWRIHPIASFLGSILPVIIISPLIYWLVSRRQSFASNFLA